MSLKIGEYELTEVVDSFGCQILLLWRNERIIAKGFFG